MGLFGGTSGGSRVLPSRQAAMVAAQPAWNLASAGFGVQRGSTGDTRATKRGGTGTFMGYEYTDTTKRRVRTEDDRGVPFPVVNGRVMIPGRKGRSTVMTEA